MLRRCATCESRDVSHGLMCWHRTLRLYAGHPLPPPLSRMRDLYLGQSECGPGGGQFASCGLLHVTMMRLQRSVVK